MKWVCGGFEIEMEVSVWVYQIRMNILEAGV